MSAFGFLGIMTYSAMLCTCARRDAQTAAVRRRQQHPLWACPLGRQRAQAHATSVLVVCAPGLPWRLAHLSRSEATRGDLANNLLPANVQTETSVPIFIGLVEPGASYVVLVVSESQWGPYPKDKGLREGPIG